MNDNNNPHDDSYKIEDAEGYVDHEIKKTILRLRDQIDDRDDQLSAMVASEEISEEKALQMFYRTVNQFLRRIEPVLRSDVPGAEVAYREAELGELVIYPPPVNIPEGPFMDEEELRLLRQFEDTNPDTTLAPESPTPLAKRKEVTGLREIIETGEKTATWDVEVTEYNGHEIATFDGHGEKMQISNTNSYDYGILAKAVRVADRFLDDAGIGIETGFRTVDDKDDKPF